MPRPLVIAHRGASADLPGNSLEAFERAVEVGADMVELDVRRAADGELVVLHDPVVGGLPVGRLTRSAIRRRAEHPVPVLAEAIDVIAGRAGLCVELKERGIAQEVLDALAGLPPEQLLLTSFHDTLVAELKRRAPHVPAGLILGLRNFGGVAPAVRARRADADAVLVRRRFLERATGAPRTDRAVHVWTINDDDGLRTYLGDERIAGVITDDPARAMALARGAAQAAVCSAQSR